jgi:hypothetical protein
MMLKAIFGAEAHWYNDVLPEDQGLGRPEAIYIGAKLAHKRFWRRMPVFCMLFEVMPKSLYSRTSGCDNLVHVKQVVQALGTFHARWWSHPKEHPVEFISKPTTDNCGLLIHALIYAMGRIKALGCFGDVYDPILAQSGVIKKHIRYMMRELHKPPHTVCHGDVHLDNIFFSDQFGKTLEGIKLIDFGNMVFMPGTFDLAYFLGQNLEPELRRAHERELVGLYHERLVEQGVSDADYSFEQCFRSYRFQYWRVLINIIFVCFSDFAKQARKRTGMFADSPRHADSKLKATYDAINKRMSTAMVELKCVELLEEEGKRGSKGCCWCVPGCA